MNIGLCVGLVILGCVCGYFMLAKIAKRVEWYVPSLSTAEMCKELRVTLSTFQALSESALTYAQASKEAFDRITAIEQRFTDNSIFIEEQLEKQLRRRFSEIMPGINEDLLRRVATQIATEFKEVVDRRTMTIGSEYVLLQDIDDFTMDVNLEGQYSDIDTLQRAIVAALRFEVKNTDDKLRLADWLERKQWNDREFRLFAGRLGAELFKLKWHGTLALRKRGQSHVQVA
jgi:hypothetical protein